MTSHPASTDNAAPDWMCILRGKFVPPKSAEWDERSAEARKARLKAARSAKHAN